MEFRLWAPGAQRVDLVLYRTGGEEIHPLAPEPDGYRAGWVEDARPGDRYRFRLDGEQDYPDPASRSQPEGVHGPSEIVDPDAFGWKDAAWSGRPLEELILYELHIGTFTPEGSFAAAAARLPDLAELGITAVEVMPIAGFPGRWNWGYDGVNLFAPAACYGGVAGFKHFVDAAHRLGLAVILDLVYNHLGPEGNYLPALTQERFLSDRHRTPWGEGINFDGPDSRAVRDLIIENALYWFHDYHLDGVRLDATHAMIDDSRPHILAELGERVHRLPGRHRFLFAEDERHDPQLLRPPPLGFGLDAIWADDLHHQIRRFTAGDREGYFAEYSGTIEGIEAALQRAWWRGDRTPPPAASPLETGPFERPIPAPAEPSITYTPPPVVTSTLEFAPARFIQCIQNHDQVGNRALGERIHHQIEPAVYRAISVLLLTAPSTPLLWMGQEWAASTPFLYFTDHPEELGRAVTWGRRAEFGRFTAFRDPEMRARIPDPQAIRTFESSRLRWPERSEGLHARTLALYRELLHLRRRSPALRGALRRELESTPLGEGALCFRRSDPDDTFLVLINLSGALRLDFAARELTTSPPGTTWRVLLASEEERFGGRAGWLHCDARGLELSSPGALVLHAEAIPEAGTEEHRAP